MFLCDTVVDIHVCTRVCVHSRRLHGGQWRARPKAYAATPPQSFDSWIFLQPQNGPIFAWFNLQVAWTVQIQTRHCATDKNTQFQLQRCTRNRLAYRYALYWAAVTHCNPQWLHSWAVAGFWDGKNKKAEKAEKGKGGKEKMGRRGGLPWGWYFNPHTHPIPTGIPIGIPIPTEPEVSTLLHVGLPSPIGRFLFVR